MRQEQSNDIRAVTGESARSWTIPLTVGAAYYISAEIGAALEFPDAPVSILWACNAIVMSALLLAPREQWWMYFSAIVPFHFFAQLMDAPSSQVIIQYFANVGLAALGAQLVLSHTPAPQRFDRVRSALGLILFAAILAPALTSVFMAAAFVLMGLVTDAKLTVIARTITNTFAVVTVVPLVVHCTLRLRAGQLPISVKRAAEGMLLALTILAVCLLLFFLPHSPPKTPLLLYVPLPLLAWAAFRFGVSGAAAACLATGALAMLSMVRGVGPVIGSNPVDTALSLVGFHVVMSIVFLVFAALLEEWRHAGQALDLSRAHFRSIFDNNVIPTAIWRDDLCISEANAAFLQLTGFSDADIRHGRVRFDDLTTRSGKPPGSTGACADVLERFDNAELELALRDGRRVPIILGHCRSSASEGGVIYALDLAAFRRAESRRQRAESLHAAVFASLHDQIAVIDGLGSVVEVNDSWRQAVDRSPETRFDRVLVGDSYLQCCARGAERTDRTAQEHLVALRAVLEGRENRLLIECREAGECDTAWFEVLFERLRRSQGGAVVTRTNVTARKRAEAEARKQRAQLTHLSRAAVLGQLSGAFAHELKQPLTSILSNAEAALRLLQRGMAREPELVEILHDIVQDDERATQVIHRLRALLDQGESERAPIDLNELVCESVELLHSELVARNVVTSLDLDSGLPPVMADRVQLQQVLINLLMNASEAMAGIAPGRRGARIGTAFDPATESAEIVIQDCGVGVPPGDAERIFQPFMTTKSHGLGLGLAICRSVAEAHRGALWAENASEGGAAFHVRIPIA